MTRHRTVPLVLVAALLLSTSCGSYQKNKQILAQQRQQMAWQQMQINATRSEIQAVRAAQARGEVYPAPTAARSTQQDNSQAWRNAALTALGVATGVGILYWMFSGDSSSGESSSYSSSSNSSGSSSSSGEPYVSPGMRYPITQENIDSFSNPSLESSQPDGSFWGNKKDGTDVKSLWGTTKDEY